MNSRSKNSIRNIIFGIGNQFINLILNFISRFIFIKVLGVDFLGLNGLFTDVLAILSLADLGLSTAISYSYYKPLAENDITLLSLLTKFYKKIYIIIAILISFIGILMYPFLGRIINSDIDIVSIRIYYLLFLSNTSISYLFIYRSAIINADQKAYVTSTISSIVNVVKIILQVIVIIIFKNYIAYLLIMILATLLNNLIVAYKSQKMYPFINNTNGELSTYKKKEIYYSIKSVFIYKLSGILLNATDNILISSIVNTNMVGFYSNYNMIIQTLKNFIGTFFSGFTASIGNLINSDQKDRSYEIFKILQVISFWLSGYLVISLFFLIDDFIVIWLGSDFLITPSLLNAIILNFYLSIVLQPLWSYREATGLFMKIQYMMFICASFNIILSVFLGINFGTTGIIFASAIARLSTYFWYEPILLYKNHFKLSSKKYFLSHFYNFLTIIISLLIINLIFRKISAISVWIWILKAIIIFIVVNCIYLIRYYKTSEFKYITSFFKEKIGKRA